MNDRFKYRVFLKYNQIMYEVDSFCYLQGLNKCVLHFKEGGQKTLKNSDFELMQCTGLKDKNDILIYEGDIVKNNQNLLYSVEFKEFERQTKFCLKRIENPDYYPHISTWQGIGYKDQKNYEVIGNIYVNGGEQ